MVKLSINNSDEGRLLRQLAEQERSTRQINAEHFHTLVTPTTVVVWTTNTEGAVTAEHPSWRALTGQTTEETLGFGWLDALHPDDRERVAMGWAEATRGKVPYEVDYRVRRADGEWRDFSVRATPVLKDGEVREWVGLSIDITERSRAERELRHSENTLRSVLTSLTSHIAVLNRAGEIIATNAAWDRFADENRRPDSSGLGVGANYFAASRQAADTFDPYAHAALAGVRSVLKGDADEFSLHYPCDSPLEKRWFAMVVSPLEGHGGGAVVAHHNITKIKRAEELLAREKEALEMIVTGAPLTEILERIIHSVESGATGLFCSILLCDPGGLHLRHGAAPSLPPDFVKLIDGAPIGPTGGACGAAAYRKMQVIVADIATDPLCADFAPLAIQHGLRACWSTPVQSGDGELLGTFAMYYNQLRTPTADDLRTIEHAVHLAEVAIVQRRTESALKKTNEQLSSLARTAPVGIAVVDAQQIVQAWSPGAEQLLGWEAQEVVGQAINLVSKAGGRELEEILRKGLQGETIAGQEIQRLHKDGSLVDLSIWTGPQYGENDAITGVIGIFVDIRERKQVEETLRQANERFQFVGQATNDTVWDWDIAKDFIWWNANFYSLFGYSESDELRTLNSWLNRLHPEDRERIEKERVEVIHGGGLFWRGEYRFQRHDGSYADILDRGFVIRDQAGKAVRLIGAMMDITERKRAEEKARHEAAWNRQILRSMVDGYILADLEGRIIETNESYRRDMGYSEEELAGKNIREIEVTLSAQEMTERIRLFQHDRVARFETKHRRKDGATVDFEVSFSVLGVAPEEKLAAFLRNVTARNRAEAVLRKSESRFRALIEASAQIVWTTTASGEVVEDSPSWRAFTGQTYDEWKGFGWMDALHPEDRERTEALWRKAVENKSTLETDYRVRHVSGEWRWTAVRVVPLFDSDGNITTWIGMNSDITKRKLIDRKLVHSRRELRSLAGHLRSVRENEATRIARELHDELGATLTGLKIDMASLGRGFDQLSDSEPVQRFRDQTARALGMVNSMMQSVRKICLELRPSVLDQLGLATAIEWQANEFQSQSGIHCRVSRPEEIAVASETATAAFRIFQEILTNVRRHSGATEVEVDLKENEGNIILAVRDNGRGLPPEVLAVTDRLGIVGMRERALAAGGSLTIESRPSAGTSICFEGPAIGPGSMEDYVVQ